MENSDTLDTTTAGTACILLALASSCLAGYGCLNEAARLHIVETIYFTIVVIVRAINNLCHGGGAPHSNPITQKLSDMVLSTLIHWVDAAFRDTLARSTFLVYGTEPHLLELWVELTTMARSVATREIHSLP